jgi:ABC-type nitrate/sulfonate/bicarbonate transport system substrate-binding protein
MFRVLPFVSMFCLWPALSYPQNDGVVRVAYYPPWNVSKVPLLLALETGIFTRNGLKVALRNAGSNENLLNAMANREADFYVASSNHVIQNKVMEGPELRIVANAGHLYFRFLVSRSITGAAELRGKKSCDRGAGPHPGSVDTRYSEKARAGPRKGRHSGPLSGRKH